MAKPLTRDHFPSISFSGLGWLKINGNDKKLFVQRVVVLVLIVVLLVLISSFESVLGSKSVTVSTNKEADWKRKFPSYNADLEPTYAQGSSDIISGDYPIINAYILAHSHCDPGWLETVDFYSKYNVSLILGNVIKYLSQDPTKRFVWSESVFLEMWWRNNATQAQRDAFVNLVNKKQIEIVNGGWVMNDEALPTYESMIDQMTQGHQFVKQNIGVTPVVVGWQIDPFGASRTFAYLLTQMGFKEWTYIIEKRFEFNWCPSKSDPTACIFTHVLDHHYSAPEICFDNGECTGFDFEGDPTVNPPITPQNIDERASLLVSYIKNVTNKSYRTNNFLIPFGNDFRFQKANLMWDNMDKLISYINSNFNRFQIHIRYSTLSEYFQSVTNNAPIESFPLKTYNNEFGYSDYFPYDTCWGSDHDQFGNCNGYWSGYFTSEPQFKAVIREGERFLRNCEFIYTICQAEMYKVEAYLNQNIAQTMQEAEEALQGLRNGLALALHHDAITGTEKRFVLKNYTDIIQNATEIVKNKTSTLFDYISVKSTATRNKLNATLGETHILNDMNQIYSMALFNSLAWTVQEYVSVLVKSKNAMVFIIDDETGNLLDVESQVVEDVNSNLHLHFRVALPPVGYVTVFIMQQPTKLSNVEKATSSYQNYNNTILMENNFVSVAFELSNGKLPYLLKSVTNKLTGVSTQLSQQIMQYTSFGDGAYIFRPLGEASALQFEDAYLDCKFSQGNVVQILSQRYTNNVTQTFILYNENEYAEQGLSFDVITSVQTPDNQEQILRFSMENTQTQLYTDSNGFEMIERPFQPVKFNDTSLYNRISGNYFPLVESAFVKGNNIQLTLFTKQAMGVSSLSNGSIEVMLNRNTLTDDDRGLAENLNVTQVITIPLRVLLANPYESNNFRPKIAKLFNHPALKIVSKSVSIATNVASITRHDIEQAIGGFTLQYHVNQRFVDALPSNVHLLSLQTRRNDSDQATSYFTVLRFHHIYEKDESSIFSVPVTLYPESIFSQYTLSQVAENTLSLNDMIKNRMNFTRVDLVPGKIRTFTLLLWKENQGDDWFSISSFLFGAAGMTVILMAVVVCISVVVSCRRKDYASMDEVNESTRLAQHFERDEYEENTINYSK
ncbi:hypothetical protein C9374_011902 [Naegleria lovaniensis]|uniref:Alpha-mannosidase n=1 Tax=Naegleria lovaniensis TaxID=51637 RepID=A0AA88GE75_NAELO|nr:uncharacterized protein C9374_011902 [Naegleria lovaniensis]KAG2373613.1 hypothetical protein C9374_011902 [Naegleria lovaniensis]